jgi:hypothetical protein
MRKLILPLLVAAILLVGVVGAVNAQTVYQRMGDVWARSLRVTNGATIGGATSVGGALTVAGTAAVTGNASTGGTLAVTGNADVGGNVSIDNLIAFGNAGNVTVTPGAVLTPANTLTFVTAAGAAGVGMGLGSTGQIVSVINMGTNAVTISDTVNSALSGDIALGQYDTLTMVFDGTRWIQLATANN